MKIQKGVDGRKHKRFQVKEGTNAVLHNHDRRIGPVIDISRNGLSFRYFDDVNGRIGSAQLEICHAEKGFYLRLIPVSTVYDKLEQRYVPFSTLINRRCGVKFEKLNDYQASLVKYFIQKFTIDES
jgi:hypothetical protein